MCLHHSLRTCNLVLWFSQSSCKKCSNGVISCSSVDFIMVSPAASEMACVFSSMAAGMMSVDLIRRLWMPCWFCVAMAAMARWSCRSLPSAEIWEIRGFRFLEPLLPPPGVAAPSPMLLTPPSAPPPPLSLGGDVIRLLLPSYVIMEFI